MKRSLYAMSGLAGVTLLAAACGGSGGYGASGAPPTTGSAAASTGAVAPAASPAAPAAPAAGAATTTTLGLASSKLGPIVVDNKGRTLYLFKADTGTTSTCVSAGCVAEWPPYIAAGTPQVGAGLAGNQVGTTARADGQQQVTYSGHPLYYFAGDTQPGSTAGQGLTDNGGPWYVVHSDGTAVDNS